MPRKASDLPQFRKAIVIQHTRGYQFDELREIADEVVFLSGNNSKTIQDRTDELKELMKMYDPEQDVLVPTGRAIVSLLVGMLMPKVGRIYMAVFHKSTNTYDVIAVDLGANR